MPDTFTAREKLQAAQREVGYRVRVYARRVADGKMSQRQADKEIGVMRAIAEDYMALAGAEERAGRLL